MPRRQIRRTDFEHRLRNMEEINGKPGIGGLSRLGGGMAGVAGLTASALRDGTEDSIAGGQLLALSASGASIASGGDYVTFDTEVHRQGFDAGGTDGQTITWPVSAVGWIQVEFAWNSYEGGGTVEIEVNGVVPPWGMLGSSTSGKAGSKRRGVDLPAGSQIRIKVTHYDGSAQTADVFVEFGVQDPAESSSPASTDVLYGYTAAATGTTSRVTLHGNSRIAAGDLLVAFVSTSEPTVTSPGDFTTVAAETPAVGSDERYIIQTRTATADDQSASWTWESTGGGGPDMSLAVMVAIIPDVTAVDGAPDFQKETAGTNPTLSTTTTEATGVLLVSAVSLNGGAEVAGMTKRYQAAQRSNVGQAFTFTLFSMPVTAGTHDVTVTGPDWITAHLVAVG